MRTRKATAKILSTMFQKKTGLSEKSSDKLSDAILRLVEESLEDYKWKRTDAPIDG